LKKNEKLIQSILIIRTYYVGVLVAVNHKWFH